MGFNTNCPASSLAASQGNYRCSKGVSHLVGCSAQGTVRSACWLSSPPREQPLNTLPDAFLGAATQRLSHRTSVSESPTHRTDTGPQGEACVRWRVSDGAGSQRRHGNNTETTPQPPFRPCWGEGASRQGTPALVALLPLAVVLWRS